MTHKTSNKVIYTTMDYSIFKKQVGNRDLKKVEDLEKVAHLNMYFGLNDYPFNYEILVNEDMEVIDGQHRLEVCKKWRCEVEYKIIPNANILDTIKMNTVNNTWTNGDYIDSYITNNVGIFSQVEALAEQYDIDILVALAIVDIKLVDRTQLIKSGGIFNIDFKDAKKLIHRYAPMIKDVLDSKVSRDNKKCNKYLVKALCKMFATDGYDHKIFMRQLDKYSHEFRNSATYKHNISMLENVYNYNRKSELFKIANV